MTRFLAICWKEFIQLRRDRPTFAMMVGLPVMQLLLFGYAINTDVRNIPTVVFDPDRSVESRGLVSRLEATGFYDVRGDVMGYDEILRAMREGRARVGIVFRPDYGERIRAGATGRVQLVIDGSDPQTVASALNTALTLSASLSSEITMSRIEAQGGHIGLSPVSMEPVTWFNPEQRTAIYIVPGLIGVILTMTMVLLTAMAIARERERGTLEQLIVSPIRSHELIAGKIVPYIAIGYLQMTLVLIVGRTVFGVPLVGSLPMLYAVSVVFIAACLAIGLFFSTIATTQQQAMQMSFFFLLPNILLSGFMFPFEAMPEPAQWISQALPLTHFHRIVRGITLKGASFGEIVGELQWILGILAVLFVLTSLRFRKKLG